MRTVKDVMTSMGSLSVTGMSKIALKKCRAGLYSILILQLRATRARTTRSNLGEPTMAEKFEFEKAFFFVSPEAWEILADAQAGIEEQANVIVDKRVPLLTAYVVSGTEMAASMRELTLTEFNIKSLVFLAESSSLPPVQNRR